jgi:GntR family transcriptional repressor for pyruvate dehydrogenase complex
LTRSGEGVEFPSLAPSRLSDRVAEELLRLVVTGVLAPGAALPSEAELARRFSVSRLTIREAVRALQARGVLTSRQGAAVTVTDGTARALASAIALAVSCRNGSFGEVMEVRGMIDREVARLGAIRRTPEDMAVVAAALDQMSAAATRRDAYSLAHAAFHSALAATAHNQGLLAMAEAIQGLLVEAMLVAFPAQGATAVDLQSHRAIATAIECGDAPAAVAATEAHLAKAEAEYARLSKEQVSTFLAPSRPAPGAVASSAASDGSDGPNGVRG